MLGVWPELDFAISAAMYDPVSGRFPAADDPALKVVREALRFLPHLMFWPALLLLALALVRPTLRLPRRALIFVVATFALGPGLIVNGVVKNAWDRPRPRDVAAFGGTQPFQPWWQPGKGWFDNRSFVSGEASSSAWTLAPAALAPPPWRAIAIAAAATYAAATSALRVVFGAHFLSDVVLGALVSLVLVRLGYRWYRRDDRQGGEAWQRGRALIHRADPTIRSADMPKGDVKKVVLAYSGGLDTSIILKWLQTTYACEVVTFTADLGQGEELEPARKKAELLGIKPENIFIEDLREEFVRDYVFPMFRANAQYEGLYLLGTSIARPLIAKRQIEIARKVGADAVCHGATGKGNDQVRFELAYYALEPNIKIIAPWREWDLTSRTRLIEFAEQNQIPIAKDKRGEAPFSVDANLLHTSSEGKVLEDPAVEVPDYVFSRTLSPEQAPDTPTYVTIGFEKGDAVSVDGVQLTPAALLTKLNELGRANGIGRLDLVENRFVGMKSRGMYETPGGTILLLAHRGIESVTLDRGAAHLKDELMPRYAELIYNGFWFAPEREMLQALIDKSQEFVTGWVRLKLYKGGVHIVGRDSPYSLYDQELVTFEEGAVAYDHRDAAGFIRLNALRLRTYGARTRKLGG
ncbi:Argininosuccinate synthase [Blastochloris viridis]|uniref:Argininosuccinate synthase n=1 Tax=Blastochloris viridis TaxID=1079 RepID=A0A0S4Q5I6_BLAVI|nr:Argininosuccinate synthase [Blastochloris viridis]